MEHRTSINIAAPAETVWSVLTEVERWPETTASMTRVELLDGRSFGLGSRARIQQPKIMTLVWTVTELEPGRSFTWSVKSPGTTGFAIHELSPGPNNTTTVTLTVRQTGPLAPIVGLFMGSLTRRYMNMEAEGLKRRSEELFAQQGAVRTAIA